MGPKCNHKCPYKKEAGEITKTEEEGRCGHRSRHWSDDITRMPAATRRWKRQEVNSLYIRITLSLCFIQVTMVAK